MSCPTGRIKRTRHCRRRKKHRVVASPLTEPDEKIARAWFELEKSREKPVTKKEV